MALITMRQLLDHAAENDYALPAFNVNNLEYVQAVMRAADAARLRGAVVLGSDKALLCNLRSDQRPRRLPFSSAQAALTMARSARRGRSTR